MDVSLRLPHRSPLLQVAKSAAATLVAWLIADWLIPGPAPVFAAIAALLTVQPSIGQSFGRGIERTVGVIAGVIVASAIGILIGTGFVSIALAVVCALLLAWALRATPGTANQVAISAMLVLAIGTTTPAYAVDRILETAIGAVIGLVINVAIVPPLALAPARAQTTTLATEAAQSLERLSDAMTTPQTRSSLDELLASARAVRATVAPAESAIATARETLALNPRARRRAGEIDELASEVGRLSAIVIQTIGMTRAFVDEYTDALATDPQVRAIAEQMRRAAHDVRLGRSSDRPRAEEPPALTRPIEPTAQAPVRWALIGSILIDLRRIHDALAAPVDA